MKFRAFSKKRWVLRQQYAELSGIISNAIICRWQVLRQQYAELSGIISNAIISETKDFFFFIAFLKYAWNWEHFQKKDEYPSLIISEIIDAERRSYLNV